MRCNSWRCRTFGWRLWIRNISAGVGQHCDNLIACDFHPHLDRPANMLRAESVTAMLVPSDAITLPYASQSMDAVVCMSVLDIFMIWKTPQRNSTEYCGQAV